MTTIGTGDWTLVIQKGAGTAAVDGGAYELRSSGTGAYADAMLAVADHPPVATFVAEGTLRVDTSSEFYSKLHFWGDGQTGLSTSGKFGDSFYIAFDSTTARLAQTSTVIGSVITGLDLTAATVSWKIDADADTGRVQVWVYTGTIPGTAQIDVTAVGGPRSGVFGFGFESGNPAVVVENALAPITVTTGVVTPPPPDEGPVGLHRKADGTGWEFRKHQIRNATDDGWTWG